MSIKIVESVDKTISNVLTEERNLVIIIEQGGIKEKAIPANMEEPIRGCYVRHTMTRKTIII